MYVYLNHDKNFRLLSYQKFYKNNFNINHIHKEILLKLKK